LSTVEDLKVTVTTFKTTFEKTKGDSLRTKNELETANHEKTELQSLVDKLTKQNKEMAQSVEGSKKSQKSHELKIERLQKENTRLGKELEGVRATKTGYEKSFAEARRREEDLGRQLKNISKKRDDLQKLFDPLAKKCTETSSLLAGATKEVEAFRSENGKLRTELEHLREELEGTVEDRDELLELLDRIVCENGTGEEKQGLGQKVERIRERNKSDEALPAVEVSDSGKTKPVGEKLVVSSEVNVNYAATGENDLFDENGKIEKNAKEMEALQEENQKLKDMVEKILTDQKKMEAVLNSLSEANAEIQQGMLCHAVFKQLYAFGVGLRYANLSNIMLGISNSLFDILL
jgi:chromosome segregation ATPase